MIILHNTTGPPWTLVGRGEYNRITITGPLDVTFLEGNNMQVQPGRSYLRMELNERGFTLVGEQTHSFSITSRSDLWTSNTTKSGLPRQSSR